MSSTRQHLKEAGETYFQHLCFASLVAGLLLSAAIACFIHALLPALCRRSASRIVALLTQLFAQRQRLRSTVRDSSGPLVLTLLIVLSALPIALMMTAGDAVLLWPIAALAAAVPLTFLLSNPDLEPVD